MSRLGWRNFTGGGSQCHGTKEGDRIRCDDALSMCYAILFVFARLGFVRQDQNPGPEIVVAPGMWSQDPGVLPPQAKKQLHRVHKLP